MRRMRAAAVLVLVVALTVAPAASAMHTAAERAQVTPLRDAAWAPSDGDRRTGITGDGVVVFHFEPREVFHPGLRDCGPLKKHRSEGVPTVLDPQVQGGGHGTAVQGVICASGAGSDGLHVGMAPDADVFVDSGCLTPHPGCRLAGFWYRTYNMRVALSTTTGNPIASAENHLDMPSDADILYVQSAGNSGGEGDEAQTIVHDGQNDSRFVRVAAGNGSGGVASYSSRGDRDDPATWPHVTAPGCMWTTVPPHGYTRWADPVRPFLGEIDCPETTQDEATDPDSTWSRSLVWYGKGGGTSRSAPVVAGAASLMFEVHPDLGAVDAKYLLTRTADPFLPADDLDGDGTVSPEEFWSQNGYKAGYGVVNATAATAAAHYMRLHPDAGPKEAVDCYATGETADGRLVLNPDGGGCSAG